MKKLTKTITQKIYDFKLASGRALGRGILAFEYVPKDNDEGLLESILVSTRCPIDKSLPELLNDSLRKTGLSRTFEYGGSGINLMTGCQDVSYYRKNRPSKAPAFKRKVKAGSKSAAKKKSAPKMKNAKSAT